MLTTLLRFNENETAQHMCPEGLYKLASSVQPRADVCMGYMVLLDNQETGKIELSINPSARCSQFPVNIQPLRKAAERIYGSRVHTRLSVDDHRP